jgi:hypothetical protein
MTAVSRISGSLCPLSTHQHFLRRTPGNDGAGGHDVAAPGIYPDLRRVHPGPEPDDDGYVTESGLENQDPVPAVQTTVIGEDRHARVQPRRVRVRLIKPADDPQRNDARRSPPRRDARPRSSDHVRRDDRSLRA